MPKACRVAVVAWVATALAVSLAQGQALSPSDCGAAAQYYLSRASQRSLPQWQGARLGQPIPCFHVTGGTSAYVFPVLKGGQEVGYVGVAAELDSYPLIRAATTPGPQARVERGLQIAARELGPAARFVGLVYAGDLDFYGLYEVEGARRLAVNLMTGESGPPEALASAFAQVQAAQAPANEARRRWRELLSPGPQAVETAKVEGAYVANVPEYTWYRSCVPTSVGMLLGYLGNQRRALNYPTSSFDWLGPDNEAWSCTTARELVDQIADLTPNSDKGPIPREGGVERNYEIRREDLLGGASTVINRHGYWAHWQTKDKFDWGAYKDWVGYGPVLILTRKFNCGGWDLGGGHAFVGIGWDSTSGENCVLLYDANDNLLTAWDTEPPKRTPGFPPPANPPGYPPASYPKVQYLPASCLGGIWWWRKGIFMGGCTGTDKLQFFVSFDGPVPVGCGPASRGGQTELWVYPYWPLPLDTGGFFPLLVPALGSFSKNGYDFPPALRFEVGGQNATVLAATCSGVLKGYRVSFKWPGVPWDPGWETDFHDYPLTVRVGDSSRTLPGVIRHRSPVPRAEIAIVLDRSETVTGAKLTRAKDAACALINQIEPETRFGLYVFPWPGYTAGRWGPPTYSPSLGFPSDHSRQVTCDWLQELRPVQGDGLCAALEGIAEHWENANGPGWQGMPRAVVVLSDGYDSQPCSDELRGGAISVNKRFYTLGYGDCNEQRLRDIATFGAGASYHHDLDPSYMPALYRAIVRSWASLPTIQAAGQSQSSTGDTFRYNFDVSAGTVSITVLVDPANCWNQFDVSLTKPDGQPLDMNDGRVYSQTPYGCAFEAVIYDPDPGTWEVTVEARNITYQADSGFKVTISAESDIGLYLAADRSECCSGDPILLSATFTDNGEPVTGATVRAEIANLGTQLHPLQRGLPPRGTLELLDDGEHGDGGASDGVYADWYTDALPVRGEPYTFFARGTADDGQGHTIERRSGDVQITVKAGQSDPGLALSPQSWQVGQITNTGSAELVCTVTTTGTDPVLVQALPSPVTVEGTNGAGQSPNPVTVSWEPLPAAPAPPTLGGSPVTSLQEEETPLFLPEDVAAVLPGTPRNCRLSFQPSLDAPAGRYWCDVIFSTAQGTARLPVEADLVRTACISGAVHGLWTLGTQQYPPSVAPEVVLKQSGAEVTRMVSETVGTYMFSGVSPGVYDLQAEAPGCAPVLRPGVNVLEGQHVVCDLALAPADPLPAGLSLFGMSLAPADPRLAYLFSATGMKLALWEPRAKRYSVLRVGQQSTVTLPLGCGAWAQRPADAASPQLPGPLLVGNEAASVKLLKGWNVVAAPYPVRCRLDPQALSLVTDEGESTLAAAKEAGLCEDHLWAYDSEKESYFLVGPLSQEEQWLDPWRGYWLNVSRDAVLRWPLVPPASPVETAARPARRQDAPPATFYVYGDDGEGGSRGSVLIGFGARADLRLASPPMSPEQQVSLASVDGKRLLGAHVVAGSPSRVCWQLSVTAPPESRVRLSWPDLSPVPSEYRLLLRDPVTGTRCLMRTCAGFDLALGAEETQRVMVIQAEQRGAGGFLVQSLAVRAGPNTASVSFTLGRPASVTMVVRNIAGRVVKRVVADRLFGSGPASVSFARVSDLGTALPAGVYLVQVTAAGEDGERSSAMSAVRW